MSLGLRTPRLAVAALLLAATAAGAGTAHAADTTTSLIVPVPAVTGQLTISATSATSSSSPTVARASDGTVSVRATLPDIAVSDSRGNRPGWSYTASMPTSLAPVTSGSAAAASGLEFQVGALPVVDGALGLVTGLHRKTGWQPAAGGAVPGLVSLDPGSGVNQASFVPEVRFTLPASTAAGDYRATITHSVI